MNRGVLYAIGAYGIWGLFPIYWKLLQSVPALQILSHRFVWSFAFLIFLIVVTKEWSRFKLAIGSRKIIALYGAAACLLAINWLTYIWGVNAGFIVETSLGYYINPLVSVLLGVIFLKEKLRPIQWLPVGLAAAGVLYLTISYGAIPWIALVLAFSFGLYGLFKKTAPLGSLHGLTLETAILFLPAAFWLVFADVQGTGAFGRQELDITILLIFTGIVTALPLLLFASAAHRINLSTLGILQYLAPTLQFLLGVFVYNEPFTGDRLIGFAIVWIALLIFTVESIYAMPRHAKTTPTTGKQQV